MFVLDQPLTIDPAPASSHAQPEATDPVNAMAECQIELCGYAQVTNLVFNTSQSVGHPMSNVSHIPQIVGGLRWF